MVVDQRNVGDILRRCKHAASKTACYTTAACSCLDELGEARLPDMLVVVWGDGRAWYKDSLRGGHR